MKLLTGHLQTLLISLLALGLAVISGCSPKPYTLDPIKTFDSDTSRIDPPKEKEQLQYWDRIDNTLFHQMEKPLNLNRVGRSAGRVLGIAGRRQADNINVLDEPPESSWYTYRHFYNEMTPEELARGPNTTPGPDTTGKWEIFQAKIQGFNPGFFVEDERGDRYLIKFDGRNYPELSTGAEVISTKLFYGAGYTVPESVITYFDPEQVTIQEGVKVTEKGRKRDMTRSDYQDIIKHKPRNEEGKIRALASKFVDGIPLGPWGFEGTRKDDPNDRVAHEHRREIRGMRVISSWVNDSDRRDANTMSVYTEEGYIAHYVQDFGNTLGAHGSGIHSPIYGQVYLIDPRFMMLNALSLGNRVNKWESVTPDPPYPGVGYFHAGALKPGRWVPAHPIPAFENMTLRDAYWGAKQVMSFSNEDIRAIVATAEYTNPEAEKYVADVLVRRRDKIGKYWFERINPLDRFSAEVKQDTLVLHFTDLGIAGALYERSSTYYEYSVFQDGDKIMEKTRTEEPNATLDKSISQLKRSKRFSVLRFMITSMRSGRDYKPVNVYVALEKENDLPRVVGIHREE